MKKVLIAAVLSLGLFSSCLGPNKWFNGLHDWNMKMADSRWANEGVFVLLTIIPVYSVAYLGDILISNSIDWWKRDEKM